MDDYEERQFLPVIVREHPETPTTAANPPSQTHPQQPRRRRASTRRHRLRILDARKALGELEVIPREVHVDVVGAAEDAVGTDAEGIGQVAAAVP